MLLTTVFYKPPLMLIFNYFIHFYANLLILKVFSFLADSLTTFYFPCLICFPFAASKAVSSHFAECSGSRLSSQAFRHSVFWSLQVLPSFLFLFFLFYLVSCFFMPPLFDCNNDLETGLEQWDDWISWYRMGQPWVWASTHWLYVYHEMHTRWNLFQRWTAAFWEHRVEPLRWSFKLWPGWGILSS